MLKRATGSFTAAWISLALSLVASGVLMLSLGKAGDKVARPPLPFGPTAR
jgi:hypothetical protein